MEMNGVRRLDNGQVSANSRKTDAAAQGACQPAFGDLLQDHAREGLNFSKHAAKRMNERDIAVDTQLMSDLEHAVEEARKKGARDVAVIGAQGVFIVNVPNNTVVTTMSQSDMKERVFTNIDSAVLM
ncbi:MAG TPA: flagellar operon protein [Lachnospiraceae bacterium]|nr:flagellar operon protein [Lachnospiraceae bacterium]